MRPLHVVLAARSLATYPEGGGHWAWVLQYPLGLRDLGHKVTVIEVQPSSGDQAKDRTWARRFIENLARHGLDKDACLVIHPAGENATVDNIECFGLSKTEFLKVAARSDLLLNLSCSVPQPLLPLFRHRVLIDVDPGHLQVSALTWGTMGIGDHHRHFSVGLNVGTDNCDVPTLGVKWEPTFPVIYLPMWASRGPLPGPSAHITSVTHWNWNELSYNGRAISISKREAYLRYLDLPRRTSCGFELAVNLTGEELRDDRRLLQEAGWTITDPWTHLATPAEYAAFIARSRAELCCAKEAFRVLNTGWVSDRSAAYLASGRPVIADETGFSAHIETGRGLFAVRNPDEAARAVEDLNARYEWHAARALEIACECFDSRRVLPRLLGQ